MDPSELVTGAEIGRGLGVTRTRVHQWASGPRYDFPPALGRYGSAKLWRWSQVVAWAERRKVGALAASAQLGSDTNRPGRPVGAG